MRPEPKKIKLEASKSFFDMTDFHNVKILRIFIVFVNVDSLSFKYSSSLEIRICEKNTNYM